MNTLPQTLHACALRLHQQHRNVDVVVLEAALNEGAKIAIEKLTSKVQETRHQMERDRIKGNNPQ